MTGIAMAAFMVGDPPIFNGLPTSIYGEDVEAGTAAVVTITVSNDGTWSIEGNTLSDSGTWLTNGNAANYDVYLALTMTTGATNTWLNLGTTQVWTKSLNMNGSSTSSASNALRIRMASDPFTQLDSAFVSIRLEKTS